MIRISYMRKHIRAQSSTPKVSRKHGIKRQCPTRELFPIWGKWKMGMTKKHFEAIAKILSTKYKFSKQYDLIEDKLIIEELTQDLSDYFKPQNNFFNEELFNKAVFKEVK